MMFEPLTGRREVLVTERRTARDYEVDPDFRTTGAGFLRWWSAGWLRPDWKACQGADWTDPGGDVRGNSR